MLNKLAILGSSNAMKPKIILETLLEADLLPDKELILFTDKEEGICVEFCKNKNIDYVIFENEKLNDEKSFMTAKKHEVDLLISAGWPHKLDISFLELFKYKSVNCHGSLLPDYRGNRAYMHYWANCENYYGATIHYMNEHFDDGKIIARGKMKLFIEETPEILHRRTAELCAYLLPTAISLIQKGYEGREIKGLKRYFNKLSPEEFEKYRAFNEKKKTTDKKLTPHKIID